MVKVLDSQPAGQGFESSTGNSGEDLSLLIAIGFRSRCFTTKSRLIKYVSK